MRSLIDAARRANSVGGVRAATINQAVAHARILATVRQRIWRSPMATSVQPSRHRIVGNDIVTRSHCDA